MGLTNLHCAFISFLPTSLVLAFILSYIFLLVCLICYTSIINAQSGLYGFNTPVSIYKDLKGTIEEIVKYYTDGEFKYTVYPASKKVGKIIYEAYSADLSREVPATWVLGIENRSTGYQYRTIYIENFAFDTTKLPTEEELQSYDFPLSLKQLFKK